MATREQTAIEPGGLPDVAGVHPWSYAASLLLVAVAYYAAARLGLRLVLVGRNITPFWPPTGIAVVAFILRPAGRGRHPSHLRRGLRERIQHAYGAKDGPWRSAWTSATERPR